MNNTENKNTSDIYCATKCINCPNESLDNFKKCLQCSVEKPKEHPIKN